MEDLEMILLNYVVQLSHFFFKYIYIFYFKYFILLFIEFNNIFFIVLFYFKINIKGIFKKKTLTLILHYLLKLFIYLLIYLLIYL